MTGFQRLARIALRTYPEPLRDDRGTEILDVLRDLEDDGRLRAASELAALVAGGLRARRELAIQGGRAHLWRTTASWIASWLAPILAATLVLVAVRSYLSVYVWCDGAGCTISYDPTTELVAASLAAVAAVATTLAVPAGRRVSVPLGLVLCVALAWRQRELAAAGAVLLVALATSLPRPRREVTRHAVIVAALAGTAVLFPPIAAVAAVSLPLVLLAALAASWFDPRAALTALALVIALTPIASSALWAWTPDLQPALLAASALLAGTSAVLAARSPRSRPA
jgi:hypothetical protein